jgi:hypothetical protein
MNRPALSVVLVGLVAIACTVSSSSDSSPTAARADVTGTYVTQSRGMTFGKPWSYSGVLVLDSTKHFGAVFNAAGSLHVELSDSSEREGLHGTYRVIKGRRRINRHWVGTTSVELSPEGSRDRHTLRMNGDSLRFAGPWWMSAGLSAMGITDPVFVRLPDSVAVKVASADSAKTTASSTPAASVSSRTAAKKAALKPK